MTTSSPDCFHCKYRNWLEGKGWMANVVQLWLMRTTLILKQTLIMIFSRIILLNEVGNIDRFLFSVFFKAYHHFEENRYTGYLPTNHNMLLFKINNFSTEKNFSGQVGVNSPSKKVVCYFGPFHRPSLALSGISPLHILLAS